MHVFVAHHRYFYLHKIATFITLESFSYAANKCIQGSHKQVLINVGYQIALKFFVSCINKFMV